MNFEWDPIKKQVSYILKWGDGETVTVDWMKFYARYFVIQHLHWDGRYKDVLGDGETQTRFFLMCDGFGKFRDYLHYFSQVGGYDWSHVRDSSLETMLEIAGILADEFWATPFSEMAEQILHDAASVGKTPPEYLE